MNEEEVKNKSLYQEKFADSNERDFALRHVESLCKSWGFSFDYDPIKNSLSIWQNKVIGQMESDVFNPEQIEEIWLEWCANV